MSTSQQVAESPRERLDSPFGYSAIWAEVGDERAIICREAAGRVLGREGSSSTGGLGAFDAATFYGADVAATAISTEQNVHW